MRAGLFFHLRDHGDGRAPARQYADALAACVRADDAGADSVWFSEHHGFADGYLPQPLTFAAAVAARTRRVRIGTAVLLAALRPPALVAEEAAVVDLLSGGRLDLGLGGGYLPHEYDLYGLEFARPVTRLFDRARDIRSLLRSDRVTPFPLQDPLPVWVGCNGPTGARRAGTEGYPLLSSRRAIAEDYVRAWAEAGHPDGAPRMSGAVNVFVSADPRRDAPVVAAAYARMLDVYRAAGSPGRSADRPADPQTLLARGLGGGAGGVLVATAADAAAQLTAHFAGVPMDTVFTWATLPGIPAELARAHVDAWSTGVREALRDGT